jgi:hypothetical protein
MGFVNRHKKALLLGTTSLVGVLLVDAYRTMKRAEAEKSERELQAQQSARYKIGVDPDTFEYLEGVSANRRYRRGTRVEPMCPPDVPRLEEVKELVDGEERVVGYRGSGLLDRQRYDIVEPYGFNSSKN